MRYKAVSIFFGVALAGYCQPKEGFDYIVVGGGTGGGTVAAELAKKGYRTLLIEAGPDTFNQNSSTPIFHVKATEDQTVSLDYGVRTNYTDDYFHPRASALGGSNVINAMIAMYPNTRDFSLMRNITEDDGWLEKNMRNYFMDIVNPKYQDNIFPTEFSNKTLLEISQLLSIPEESLQSLLPPKPSLGSHGKSGWLTTSHNNFLRQLSKDPALFELMSNMLGNNRIDINGYDAEGNLQVEQESKIFLPQSIDPRNYQRTSFPKYLHEVSCKSPLTIWTDTLVTKVIFKNQRAIGVEYRRGRQLYDASTKHHNCRPKDSQIVVANKEIILSAGAFNTPQLLMLSGIGDRAHLESHNIPVIADIWGVGRNLMDRYEVPIVLEYPDPFDLIRNCTFNGDGEDPCYQAYLNLTGPYTSNGIISGELQKSSSSLTEPDLFLMNLLSDFHGYFRGYSKNFAKKRNCSTRLILKAHTNNTLGRVQLKSSDPYSTPHIDFHAFEDGGQDLNILVEAIKRERSRLQELESPHEEIYPGLEIQTDEEIKTYIRTQSWGHHACCSARIGSRDDPKSVLDPDFKVRGVKGLRVVDASAFPKIPGYFPFLYLHMFAMKAADIFGSDVTDKGQ